MRKRLKWTIFSIIILIFGFFGYYAYSAWSFSNKISTADESKFFQQFDPTDKTSNVNVNVPPKWEGKDRINILLLGGDARDAKKGSVPRSDTILLVSIDPVTKKGHLFSILRDFYVDIPGHGKERINAAVTFGGPNLAMKTIGNLLDLPVHFYVYTDFEGFKQLVDAIGGIEFEVEKNMKYSDSADGHQYDIDLKKGLQHLDGNMALQYVRFRHDARSDYARTERQRNLLQAIAQKMKSTVSLLKLPMTLNKIEPYIETDLSVIDMLKLGALGFDLKLSEVVSQQIPPAELLIEQKVGGASVIGADQRKLQQFVRDLFAAANKPVNDADSAKSDAGNAKIDAESAKSSSAAGDKAAAGGSAKSSGAGDTGGGARSD